MSGKKLIRSEFYLICTENDQVIANEYDDHSIEIVYEYHLRNDKGDYDYIYHHYDGSPDYHRSGRFSEAGMKTWYENIRLYQEARANI